MLFGLDPADFSGVLVGGDEKLLLLPGRLAVIASCYSGKKYFPFGHEGEVFGRYTKIK